MTASEKTELILLGIALESPDCQSEALERLAVEDFTTQATRRLWGTLAGLHRETGAHVDMAAMVAGLPNELFVALTEVMESAEATRSTEGYRRLIQAVADNSDRLEAKRELEGLAKRFGTLTPAEIAGDLKRISDAIAGRRARPDSQDYGDLMMAAFNAATDKRAAADRIRMNIPPVDRILGDIIPGNVVTIAARTGVGKSSIAIAPAVETSRTRQVVYVSTEMSRSELALRNLAHTSDVGQDLIRNMSMTQPQMDQVTAALMEARTMRMQMVDDCRTVSGIEAIVDATERRGAPCRLLVVDHIGHLKPGAGYKNRDEYSDIKESCVRLKHLALSRGIVVLLVAQLSRRVDEYDEPPLAALRDCGEIEQISDKVLMIWKEKGDLRLRHCKVAKARAAEGDGRCDLLFYGSTMRFYGAGKGGGA